MTGARLLPAGFEDLEACLDWALTTERERTLRRKTATMAEILRFWDAIAPHLGDALEYLDQSAEDDLTDDGRRLFYLTLAMMEVAPAVENYGEPNVPLSADFRRWNVYQ